MHWVIPVNGLLGLVRAGLGALLPEGSCVLHSADVRFTCVALVSVSETVALHLSLTASDAKFNSGDHAAWPYGAS